MSKTSYKYFTGSYASIQDVKNEYKRLAKLYHPDLNGNSTTAIMQEVNSEYDRIIIEVNNKQDKKVNINNYYEGLFKNVVIELLKIKDITIDVVGFYLWIDGNTKQHKDELKKIGCLYSCNQKKWYYNGCQHKSRKCSKKSWNEITSYYGCYTIDNKQNERQDDKEDVKQLKASI